MRLILLRHGETEENTAGIIQGQNPGRLTDRGRRQSRAAALSLKSQKIDAIYSSDLQRARDTVQYVLSFHALPVSYSAALRERSFGQLQGKPGCVYLDELQKSAAPRVEYRPPGGESILDLQRRTDKFLETIQRERAGQVILACTHGGVITTILASVLRSPVEEMLAFHFYNASLTEIDFSTTCGIRVTKFNSVEHLCSLKDASS